MRSRSSELDPALKAHVIPNGVDTDFYQRDKVTPLDLPPHSLVFTGTMDFRPNVDAVLWFAHDVLPLIKPRVPRGASLHRGAASACAAGCAAR